MLSIHNTTPCGTTFRLTYPSGEAIELHVLDIVGGAPILWWQIGEWSCAAKIGEA